MRIESDYIKTGIAMAALIVLFIAGVWMPDRLQAASLRQRMSEAQQQLDAGQAASVKLRALRPQTTELRQRVEATAKYVPVESEIAELMRELHTTLQRCDARDIATRHGNEFRGMNYTVIPITLEFRSSFIDAFVFVEHIESMSRLVRVDRLQVMGKRDHPGALLDVTVELSAFYARQEAE